MKTFWILWNPEGHNPPRVRFNTYEAAKKTADDMQKKIGVGVMYVMEAKSGVTVQMKARWENAKEEKS